MWKPIVILAYVVTFLSPGASSQVESFRQPTIAGFWTLNHELTDSIEMESRVDVTRIEGPTDPTNAGSSPEPARMGLGQALVQELLQPDERLTVAPSADGVVTIVDGRGVSRVYQTSGRPEWHTFDGGQCETRTLWRGPALQQEIRISASISVVRFYRPTPASDRLVETVVLKAAGSRDLSLIRIYESDRLP